MAVGEVAVVEVTALVRAILHAAHTETLQRGEILTRSVSEEIGCEASLTLRVSVRNDRVEYNPQRADFQVLVDERIGRVAEKPAGDAGDVRDLARVMPLVPRPDYLPLEGDRGEQAKDFAFPAVARDQLQPVSSLGPVAFTAEDFGVLTEIVG